MKTKQRIALSVFVTAFAFGLNITGISPVLGILNEKYQEYGTSMIQLLQTLPYLFLMVGSLVVGWLTTKFSKKKITMAGLLIVALCGAVPFVSDSFAVLFAARLLIGFGFGIVGPMNTAIVADFFPPEERASYMGLHVIGMGVGTMAGNLIGGFLAGFGYRYFYLVYLVALVAMLGIGVLLIETPPTPAEKSSGMKLNKMVYAISFASLVHTLFINAYSTNIGIYIMNNVSDNASLTGVVTAVNAAAAMIMGACFAKVMGVFKQYTLTVSIASAAVGYGLILLLPGMAGVYAASVFCGFSLSCFMANGSYLISVSVEKEAVAKAGGMFSIIGGIGGLIAPIVLGNVSGVMPGGNTPENQFLVSCIGMAVLAVIALMAVVRKK